MSVLVLFEATAAAGQEAAMEALFADILPDTRAYEGCESLTAHRNQDAPAELVLVERWSSRERHGDYLRWREERGDIERLAGLLAGPPVTRYLDDLAI